MKFFKMMAALLAALCLTLGLAACGERGNADLGKPSDQTGQNGQNSQNGQDGQGTEPATLTYSVTVRLPDGETPCGGISVQLVSADKNYTASTNESGVAVWQELPAGDYAVHIEAESCPDGCVFDNTKYTVSKAQPTITVLMEDANGTHDLSAYLGNWRSFDKESYLLEVEEGGVYFNGEEVTAQVGELGVSFRCGGISYLLSFHEEIEGACLLSFDGEEVLLLPEKGLKRVSVPQALNGTWTCEALKNASIVFDGSNFSLATSAGKLNDGYTVSVKGTEDLSIAAIIETGTNSGVYLLSYSETAQEIEVELSGSARTFRKTGSGSEADPYVITELAGDYSANLRVERISNGNLTQYYLLPVYYCYVPAARETFTVWNPNWTNPEHRLSVKIYTGRIDQETDSAVLDWSTEIPEAYSETFTLQAGKTYRICLSADPDLSQTSISGVSVSFSVVAGSTPPITTAEIPEQYHGTWYNEADNKQTVLFEHMRALWNNKPFSVTRADGTSVVAQIEGKAATFTLEGATLIAVVGEETFRFTLISGARAPIAGMFEGFFADPQNPTDLIIVEAAPRGSTTEGGSFKWLGHDAQIASYDLGTILLVVGDEIWRAELMGSFVVMKLRGSTDEPIYYEKCDYIKSFTAPYVGSFADENNEVSLTVAASSFAFNGETVEVWKMGDVLLFAAGDTAYALEKTGEGLRLSDLSAQKTWALLAK